MKRNPLLTSALVAAALCFTGLLQVVSAQDPDKEAQAAEAAEAAEESKAAKEAEAAAAAEAAKLLVIDERLLAKYKAMLRCSWSWKKGVQLT
jgi:hypothetical protein